MEDFLSALRCLCGLFDTSGATRTALTSQRLQRCPAVNAIYCAALPNTLPPERRARRKQRVKGALCSLLGCQRNRLCCYNQVGQLSALLPRILRLQLLSGHSLFWEQIRLSSEQTDESGGPEGSVGCFYKRMSEINPKERRIPYWQSGKEKPIPLKIHQNKRDFSTFPRFYKRSG